MFILFRAKIAEMRTTLMDQERDIRERVKEEYDELVNNLFSSAFDLKRQFDDFRSVHQTQFLWIKIVLGIH